MLRVSEKISHAPSRTIKLSRPIERCKLTTSKAARLITVKINNEEYSVRGHTGSVLRRVVYGH